MCVLKKCRCPQKVQSLRVWPIFPDGSFRSLRQLSLKVRNLTSKPEFRMKPTPEECPGKAQSPWESPEPRALRLQPVHIPGLRIRSLDFGAIRFVQGRSTPCI